MSLHVHKHSPVVCAGVEGGHLGLVLPLEVVQPNPAQGPGCEPFFGVLYEDHCLRGCGKPRVTSPASSAEVDR